MSDLTVLVEPLKRELAVPGEYDTVFPDTDDTALADSLADAFSEAQLDGYFTDHTLDLDTYETDPDISAAAGALIVIYASQRIIRAWIRALNLSERYKAGPTEYEVERSSTLLKQELAYLEARKQDLLQQSRHGGSLDAVYDQYFTRSAVNWALVGGLTPAEIG